MVVVVVIVGAGVCDVVVRNIPALLSEARDTLEVVVVTVGDVSVTLIKSISSGRTCTAPGKVFPFPAVKLSKLKPLCIDEVEMVLVVTLDVIGVRVTLVKRRSTLLVMLVVTLAETVLNVVEEVTFCDAVVLANEWTIGVGGK